MSLCLVNPNKSFVKENVKKCGEDVCGGSFDCFPHPLLGAWLHSPLLDLSKAQHETHDRHRGRTRRTWGCESTQGKTSGVGLASRVRHSAAMGSDTTEKISVCVVVWEDGKQGKTSAGTVELWLPLPRVNHDEDDSHAQGTVVMNSSLGAGSAVQPAGKGSHEGNKVPRSKDK